MGNITLRAIISKIRKQTFDYGNWFNKKEIQPYVNFKSMMFFVIFFNITLLLGLFVFGGLNSLKTVLTTSLLSPEEFGKLRAESGVNGLITPIYVYVITAIGRIVAFVYLAYSIVKKKKIHTIIAYAYIVLLLISQLANLSKSSFFFLFIQVIVLHLLIYNVKFNILKITISVITAIIVLIPIYLFTTNAENASVAMQLISNRVFNEPNRVLALYFEAFPSVYPHTWGMNIRLVHNLLTTETFHAAETLFCGDDDLGCTVNSIFLADAWVDFSFCGIIIESFFLGAYLFVIDYWVFKEKTFFTKAMFAGFFLTMFSLPSIALLACMVTFGLITIPLMVTILKIKY